MAFQIETEKTEIKQEYQGLLEIIANILADAMAKIEAEKEITHRAYFDQLTGLPNRLLFKDRLIQGLSGTRN